MSNSMYNLANNTSQAYRRFTCVTLKPGGCFLMGVDNMHALRIIRSNTPAMPLCDAHFGGFFASGVCK